MTATYRGVPWSSIWWFTAMVPWCHPRTSFGRHAALRFQLAYNGGSTGTRFTVSPRSHPLISATFSRETYGRNDRYVCLCASGQNKASPLALSRFPSSEQHALCEFVYRDHRQFTHHSTPQNLELLSISYCRRFLLAVTLSFTAVQGSRLFFELQ